MDLPTTRHRICKLATCNLNQWAMNFDNNTRNIKASIDQAVAEGCTYRLGPELEIPGYGCEDHFIEADTIDHSWEVVMDLIQSGYTDRLVVDVGMPVLHNGVRYNCRVIMLRAKILLIRPKLHLADDGNYREGRYFSAWKRAGVFEYFKLPLHFAQKFGQATCPFGDAALQFQDALLAVETCEELFTPMAPNIRLALSGVDIIANGSGSHHQLRKLDVRLDLIRSATAKAGGVYLYANQRGCDGGRLYFDGCACVLSNGQLLAQGGQFNLKDVEVVTATVDLHEVQSYRAAISSLQEQAASTLRISGIYVPFHLCGAADSIPCSLSAPITPRRHQPEEEIAYGPAAWLWDYLRRSGASGYLLPLSGGADSSSTAAIVGGMCQMVVDEVSQGNEQVLTDALRIGGFKSADEISGSQVLADRLFVTMYMGTVNSSTETAQRAKCLAKEIGAYHFQIIVDPVVSALKALFVSVTGRTPEFASHGGSQAENLALQNIQARLRMVIAFLFAQLVLWVRGRTGFLLVLGSANVDELLRGYLTKYDCSSADINPIGGVSKTDLRSFLKWGADHLGYPSLADVERAPPTAELEPLVKGKKPQNDEDDMGISYEHLSVFGRLRKISRLGPVSMFFAVWRLWGDQYTVAEIAAKVKFFFRYYAMNRHKATTITPAYHAESYSPDDNRFDHRQFLYNITWPWQFRRIDHAVEKIQSSAHGKQSNYD
eukprot:jgi/Ulvmu1/5077/UM021_0094.1